MKMFTEDIKCIVFYLLQNKIMINIISFLTLNGLLAIVVKCYLYFFITAVNLFIMELGKWIIDFWSSSYLSVQVKK